jgi:ABC-type dipeptide/oligopeptide/nickel transport system ATPase component
MKELLRLEDVHITIKKGGNPIVKGVSLSVRGGKATVIVGESGSGKTMLIKAITGILNRNNLLVGGRAYLDDVDLFSLTEKARRHYCSRLALIMQNPMTSFDPSVKIGKQMTVGIKQPKLEAYEKAIQALNAVGLPRAQQLLQAYPHELSGGMLQRVMIAIAMMSGAKLIAADEPTTALDVVSQGLVLDKLNMLKSSGVGILLVTHDFFVAKKTADIIVVMKDGELVETGKADTILCRPQHEYTKALLEASILRRREVGTC